MHSHHLKSLVLAAMVIATVYLAAALAGETLPAHMGEHFGQATRIQDAIIDADLEAAQRHAGWLADHPADPAFPDNALDTMRAAAAGVLTAENNLEAAHAFGRIGAACAQCHDLMEVKTNVESSLNVPMGDSLRDRMTRHRWGADRLWEGLVANSDAAWQAGAEALTEAPLAGEDIVGKPHAGIDLLGFQVKRLATRGLATTDRDARGEVYGEFLSLCAACHVSFRNRSDRAQ